MIVSLTGLTFHQNNPIHSDRISTKRRLGHLEHISVVSVGKNLVDTPYFGQTRRLCREYTRAAAWLNQEVNMRRTRVLHTPPLITSHNSTLWPHIGIPQKIRSGFPNTRGSLSCQDLAKKCIKIIVFHCVSASKPTRNPHKTRAKPALCTGRRFWRTIVCIGRIFTDAIYAAFG